MANLDLSQLQNLLDNASKDSNKLRDLKSAFRKLQVAMDEVAAVLDDTYEPKERTKPGRKTGAAKGGTGTGRGPGRPKKNQEPAAE